mmetsp:Transcript_174462/g.559264  ORF Transcript_174462/g.559264 Transcript_174462/m.559264 type:complete len:647 (-) Transcript_174462:344-2284(-)
MRRQRMFYALEHTLADSTAAFPLTVVGDQPPQDRAAVALHGLASRELSQGVHQAPDGVGLHEGLATGRPEHAQRAERRNRCGYHRVRQGVLGHGHKQGLDCGRLEHLLPSFRVGGEGFQDEHPVLLNDDAPRVVLHGNQGGVERSCSVSALQKVLVVEAEAPKRSQSLLLNSSRFRMRSHGIADRLDGLQVQQHPEALTFLCVRGSQLPDSIAGLRLHLRVRRVRRHRGQDLPRAVDAQDHPLRLCAAVPAHGLQHLAASLLHRRVAEVLAHTCTDLPCPVGAENGAWTSSPRAEMRHAMECLAHGHRVGLLPGHRQLDVQNHAHHGRHLGIQQRLPHAVAAAGDVPQGATCELNELRMVAINLHALGDAIDASGDGHGHLCLGAPRGQVQQSPDSLLLEARAARVGLDRRTEELGGVVVDGLELVVEAVGSHVPEGPAGMLQHLRQLRVRLHGRTDPDQTTRMHHILLAPGAVRGQTPQCRAALPLHVGAVGVGVHACADVDRCAGRNHAFLQLRVARHDVAQSATGTLLHALVAEVRLHGRHDEFDEPQLSDGGLILCVACAQVPSCTDGKLLHACVGCMALHRLLDQGQRAGRGNRLLGRRVATGEVAQGPAALFLHLSVRLVPFHRLCDRLHATGAEDGGQV